MTMVRFLGVGYGPFADVGRPVARQLADTCCASSGAGHEQLTCPDALIVCQAFNGRVQPETATLGRRGLSQRR
jgi:hypothetical protein